MTLLEMNALLTGKFATRVKSASLVAAMGVQWVAPDWASAGPVERASRQVLAGADLSLVVLRMAVTAYELQAPMKGADDVEVPDATIIELVGPILVGALTTGQINVGQPAGAGT